MRSRSENDSSKEHCQCPRSGTRDSDQKLPHLPMPENEAHELPLPSRTHTTTSQTTKRKRANDQHAIRSDQAILRHTIKRQELRRVESSQGRENFPFKRHSRRDNKSTKDPVLNHNQRIVRGLERSLRVPTPLPTLKLYQTHPARRRLRPSPRKTGAPSRGDDTGKRRQADTQPLAPRRDDPRNSIIYHRASVQKRRQHPRRVSRIRRYHHGRRRQRRTTCLRRSTGRDPRLHQVEEWKSRALTLRG